MPVEENQVTHGGNQDKLDSVHSLLQGDEKPPIVEESPAPDPSGGSEQDESPQPQDGESQTEESKSETQAEAEKPILFSDLAKGLGVEPGDLYDVEIALSEGREPVTLGALKDSYQDQAQITERETTLAEREVKASNDVMTARRQLEQLVQLLPTIPPELIKQVETLDADKLRTEQRLMVEAIPEWSNAAVLAADSKAIAEHLKPYGFSAAEVGLIQDHRLAKYVRDQMLREQRIKDATGTANAKTAAKNTGKKPARRGPKQDRMAKLRDIAATGKQGQRDAVAELLRG